MRVLYIIRDRSSRNLQKRLHRWAVGFLDGQDGFFEAALHKAARVTRCSLQEFHALPDQKLRQYNAIVFNGKSGLPWLEDPAETLRTIARIDVPLGLFVGHAQPCVMGTDAVLDRATAIFKREPFADTGRYRISAANADKIVPTNLANPLVSHSWRFPWRNRTRPLDCYAWQTPDQHDVFFIGTVNHNRFEERIAAWQAVCDSDFNRIGGLLPKHDFAPNTPPDLVTQPLGRRDYRNVLMASRINLALEGIGPFTFRHLEQFYCGAFTLSTPHIRPLRLRSPLIDGQDYVAFDNIDDMVDKIRWYLDHDADRELIAKNGRAAYERLYDVASHAEEIRAALFSSR